MSKTDRSRVECGQRCERERWWNYHYQGALERLEDEDVVHSVPGVVLPIDSLDLLFGLAVHEYVEVALTGGTQRVALSNLVNAKTSMVTPDGVSVVQELHALYKGLVHVFDKYMLPRLLSEYDHVASEIEMNVALSEDVQWMSRLDGVLRRKSDGLWFVLEVKTSSSPGSLLAEASTNFQLLMEVESMRRHYNLTPEQCGGALLLVFNKGYKLKAAASEVAAGYTGVRRISPFTYWYSRETVSGEIQWQRTWKSGFERRGVWTIPGLDVSKLEMDAELTSQVQLYPSVSFNAQRIESVIEQIIARERLYADTSKTVDQRFTQNFKMCTNSGGFKRECPYKVLCFSPTVASNPYQAGYVPRTANHRQEEENDK